MILRHNVIFVELSYAEFECEDNISISKYLEQKNNCLFWRDTYSCFWIIFKKSQYYKFCAKYMRKSKKKKTK